jgi:hypothetical protein
VGVADRASTAIETGWLVSAGRAAIFLTVNGLILFAG